MLALQRLRAYAQSSPEEVAHTDPNGFLSYTAWEELSSLAAKGLLELGLQTGQKVALAFGRENWTRFAVAYLACLKGGVVAVVLPEGESVERTQRLLTRTGVQIVIQDDNRMDDSWGTAIGVLDLCHRGSIGRYLPSVGIDTAADITFTSGTTDEPKAVEGTRSTVDGLLGLFDDWIGEIGSAAHAIPVGTVFGQAMIFLPLLRYPWKSRSIGEFIPNRVRETVVGGSADSLFLTPSMLALSLNDWAAGSPLGGLTLKAIGLASAPVDEDVVRALFDRLPKVNVFSFYGLTELFPAIGIEMWDRETGRSGYFGMGGTRIEVVDGRNAFCPIGAQGHVVVKPPTWWSRRRLDGPVLPIRDGWFDTGDLGHRCGSGAIIIDGRTRDFGIVGGRKVHLEAIRRLIVESGSWIDAFVWCEGSPDRLVGEQIIAAVVANPDSSLDSAIQSAEERICVQFGGEALPQEWWLVEDGLPVAQTGKVSVVSVRESGRRIVRR